MGENVWCVCRIVWCVHRNVISLHVAVSLEPCCTSALRNVFRLFVLIVPYIYGFHLLQTCRTPMLRNDRTLNNYCFPDIHRYLMSGSGSHFQNHMLGEHVRMCICVLLCIVWIQMVVKITVAYTLS
jgi:hypothetical protein